MSPARKKAKIAIYWLGACGGCDSAIVDLGGSLLELAAKVEIVLWPAVLDFKYDRIRSLGDKELALTIISGCVRNSEHREMAELLRTKSYLVLACGACACFGGTPGLANLRQQGDIISWVCGDAPTVVNPEGIRPQPTCRVNGTELHLPRFYDHVHALHQIIEVDYYLPGCPPPTDLFLGAIDALLSGKLPHRGSTLAPQKPLCDSCPRAAAKPARLEIRTIHRCHEVEVDPTDCFLAKGVICLGPATRGGCGGTCLAANTPCRGCFGPVDGVRDAGARFLSSLAALIAPEDDEKLRELLEAIADPAGYGCRFTQPVSILGERNRPDEEEEE